MHLGRFVCGIFLPVKLAAETIINVFQLLLGIGRLHDARNIGMLIMPAVCPGQAVYIAIAGCLHEILVLPKRVRLFVFAFVIDPALPRLMARPRGRAGLISRS